MRVQIWTLKSILTKPAFVIIMAIADREIRHSMAWSIPSCTSGSRGDQIQAGTGISTTPLIHPMPTYGAYFRGQPRSPGAVTRAVFPGKKLVRMGNLLLEYPPNMASIHI